MGQYIILFNESQYRLTDTQKAVKGIRTTLKVNAFTLITLTTILAITMILFAPEMAPYLEIQGGWILVIIHVIIRAVAAFYYGHFVGNHLLGWKISPFDWTDESSVFKYIPNKSEPINPFSMYSSDIGKYIMEGTTNSNGGDSEVEVLNILIFTQKYGKDVAKEPKWVLSHYNTNTQTFANPDIPTLSYDKGEILNWKFHKLI